MESLEIFVFFKCQSLLIVRKPQFKTKHLLSTSLGLAEDIYLVVVNKNQLSSETNPGCFGFIGDYTTQLCGDYFINHEIRIPSLNNQYFHGKYSS